MRTWLISAAILAAIVLVTFSFRGCFYSENYARQQARQHLESFLKRSGKLPEKLGPFRPAEVGGARWAFEANYDNTTLYGVWIGSDGHFEIYSESMIDRGNPEP